MHRDAIFAPMFGMFLLTFMVWIAMYVRRLHYIFKYRIHPQRLTTLDKAAGILPEEIHWPAHNLRNLFELPVVFYALCVYLYVTGRVDPWHVAAAWSFLGLRVVHSLIHCTVNVVRLRFATYVLGAIVLWLMVLRAALDLYS